jgi:transcriptional regulator GlxA family with amidase domain
VTRSVVILGFPGVQALDLVGPYEVFATASQYLTGRPGYDVSLVSSGGVPVSTGSGMELVTHPLPDAGAGCDTLLLPGGVGVPTVQRDAALMEWIRTSAR